MKDIAEALGVSVRTLWRDIEVLRERGLPIEADRGRGGGIRLHWSWGIGRIALSYREAVDLLVSLAVAEQMDSPILMANLNPIRQKLMASFSPAVQSQIKGLKSRILVGVSASPRVQTGFTKPSPEIVKSLHEAFLLMKVARITYEDEKGAVTERDVETHFLLLNYPVWYALCWDRLRSDIRTFRCDRVLSLEAKAEEFSLLPFEEFQAALEGANLIVP